MSLTEELAVQWNGDFCELMAASFRQIILKTIILQKISWMIVLNGLMPILMSI